MRVTKEIMKRGEAFVGMKRRGSQLFLLVFRIIIVLYSRGVGQVIQGKPVLPP